MPCLMVGSCQNIKGGGFAEWPAARCWNANSNSLNGSVEQKRYRRSIKLERDTKPATNAFFYVFFFLETAVAGRRMRGACWTKKGLKKVHGRCSLAILCWFLKGGKKPPQSPKGGWREGAGGVGGAWYAREVRKQGVNCVGRVKSGAGGFARRQ